MTISQSVAGLAPRQAAARRLARVLAGARFSPFEPSEIADPRDRALANRLVTTALRRHGHLDAILTRLVERGLPGRAGSFEPVLRLALAQLLYLPALGDHSALHLAGEALKADRRAAHFKGLANAVLRRAQREREALLELPGALLFPESLRAGWTRAYGAAAVEGFAERLLAGAPLDLTLPGLDPALVTALGAAPVLADTVRLVDQDRPVDALPGYAEGRWWVQDAAAAIAARLVTLAEGARVLDFCAAPGGKTAQLARAGYKVTALDADAARLDRLGANLTRLGLGAKIVLADAARYRPDTPFEAVLVDAPCSATGTFRRHPEVIWHRDRHDVAGRVALQRDLLANAVAALKPGGVLVYCVCSLEPEEGEAQAAWIKDGLGLAVRPVTDGELGGWALPLTGEGYVRTHPAMTLPSGIAGGLDGFFIARFQKPD